MRAHTQSPPKQYGLSQLTGCLRQVSRAILVSHAVRRYRYHVGTVVAATMKSVSASSRHDDTITPTTMLPIDLDG